MFTINSKYALEAHARQIRTQPMLNSSNSEPAYSFIKPDFS